MKPRTVQLEGGPFDGRFMVAAGGPMLAVVGDPLPDGKAARYLRRADDPSRYRYALDVTVTDEGLAGTWPATSTQEITA